VNWIELNKDTIIFLELVSNLIKFVSVIVFSQFITVKILGNNFNCIKRFKNKMTWLECVKKKEAKAQYLHKGPNTFNFYLVRRKTLIRDMSATSWYHPVPSHQKAPVAAFPVQSRRGSYNGVIASPCYTLTGLNDWGKRIISQRIRYRDGCTRITRAEKLGREVQVKMISVFRKKSYGGSLCRKLNDVRKRRKWERQGEHAGVWIISTWRTQCQPQHGLQLPSHKRTGRAEASANPQKTVTWVNQKRFRQHPAI